MSRVFLHHKDDFILRAETREPNGPKFRRVWNVEPSNELETFLWEKIKDKPSMFGIVPLKDRRELRKIWNVNHQFMMIDNVGLVAVDLRTRSMPNMHITYWDGRMRGRETIGRAICEWCLDYFDVPTLIAQVPAGSKVVLAHAKRVGFVITQWYSASVINAKHELDDLVELTYRHAL